MVTWQREQIDVCGLVKQAQKLGDWAGDRREAETTEGAGKACDSGLYEASVPALVQTEHGPSQQGKNTWEIGSH